MYIFQPDRYLLQQQIRKVSHFIIGRTLDVGAGEFDRYKNFFKTGEYIRMDVSEYTGIDVIGSVSSIPFPDESFDSIVCTQVLEHVPDPKGAVKEMSRVLKTGGHILITVPQSNELHEEPHDYFRYTKFGLIKILSDSHLNIVYENQRGGFFATRAQMAIRYCIDRFQLYHHPVLGRVLAPFLKIYGMIMLSLDNWDCTCANRKHAIGWCVVTQKK